MKRDLGAPPGSPLRDSAAFPLRPARRQSHGGHGHGHGHTHRNLIIILYAKPGERAHLQNRDKRTRAIPAVCMRWALIEMYLRSQSPIKTDRGVRSCGSDKTGVGTCPAGQSETQRDPSVIPSALLPLCGHRYMSVDRDYFFRNYCEI